MNESTLQLLADEEFLARFITDEYWIKSDQTLRHYAFMPPKDLQLSVTRKIDLSEEELWTVGQDVVRELAAKKPGVQLYGRADFRVRAVSEQKLCAEACPVHNNPNHAHIVGWPAQKPAQKSIAQELAAKAGKAILCRR